MSTESNTNPRPYQVSYEREDKVFGGTVWTDVPGRLPLDKAVRLAEALADRPENIRARVRGIGRKDRFFS